MNKQRIVIFGGSFDPIHIGHVNLASEVLRAGLASEVWFMVSPQNPHKQGCLLSDEKLRLKMVELAIAGNERFKACDFEFFQSRPSYTVNTLAELERHYPDKEFILLVGADNWAKFDKWYKADEILAKYELLVYPRGNEEMPQLPTGVTWLPAKLYDVSSTMVRKAVVENKNILSYVSPEVAEFIKEHGLYENDN